MNPNEPSLSSSADDSARCPKCGTVQNLDAPFCANCGAALGPQTPLQRSNIPRTIAMTLLVIGAGIFGLGALLLGALGACSAIVARIGVDGSRYEPTMLLQALALALATVGCIGGIIYLQNRKNKK